MSNLTDRLYAAWLRSCGGGAGRLLTTGRPARVPASTAQKAKTPGKACPGSSNRNPIMKGSNHGFSQV
jgi:hypothetical protein